VTASAFVSTVDDVTRFGSAHQLEAYFSAGCEWERQGGGGFVAGAETLASGVCSEPGTVPVRG